MPPSTLVTACLGWQRVHEDRPHAGRSKFPGNWALEVRTCKTMRLLPGICWASRIWSFRADQLGRGGIGPQHPCSSLRLACSVYAQSVEGILSGNMEFLRAQGQPLSASGYRCRALGYLQDPGLAGSSPQHCVRKANTANAGIGEIRDYLVCPVVGRVVAQRFRQDACERIFAAGFLSGLAGIDDRAVVIDSRAEVGRHRLCNQRRALLSARWEAQRGCRDVASGAVARRVPFA